MSKKTFASETDTTERWGELWITNWTSGAGSIPSANGNTFFSELPALSRQENTLFQASEASVSPFYYIIFGDGI